MDRGIVDFLSGGGEMGALMRAKDWRRTPLGDPADWPQSLKTALGILLSSGYPMYIAWGEEFVQFYNDAYRPILGSTKHPAALGRSTVETFAEIWDFIGPMFRDVMASGKASTFVDQLLPLDRHGYVEECYFTFSYSAVLQEGGPVGGVFVTVLETTERVLRERRLRTLRDLLHSRGRSSAEICAAAADILAGNSHDVPFAALYLADGRDARLAGSAGGMALPPRLDRDDPDLWWSRALRESETGLCRVPLPEPLVPDGGAWPEPVTEAVAVPIVPIGHAAAAAILVAGVSPRRSLDADYADFFRSVASNTAGVIAEAEAYENQRRRAEALAELDRAKTAFFSNVSHEFRTPLTLMLGPLGDCIATEPARLAERRRDLEIAYRNGLRLMRLVNTLLDFSRVEAGRVEAVYEPLDIAAFTAELASNFRSACERAGLVLSIDCRPMPEPAYVDREMWEKIVLNLLSNAFKYTFEGRIEVALHQTAGSRAVELSVKDTGVGIPADQLPLVFDRFHRVTGQRGRTHEGSGIGLALVQELVRLHGGSVRVASVLGEGSEFTVTLPLGSDHLPAGHIGRARPQASTATGAVSFVEEALRWLPDERPDPTSEDVLDILATATETRRWAPVADRAHRVLIADDNADMRDYLRRLLADHYRVEAVADGESALQAIRTNPPDLLLSDVMMPRLDGFALLRTIRADPDRCDLPIILLSARAGEEATIEGRALGADDYLVKPFSARELRARIASQIQLAALRREVARHEKHYARELEGKVIERTRELAEANRRLTAEIEERRRAESERDRLFELSPDLLAIASTDGYLRRVNPIWQAVLGYGPDELIARPFLDLVHPEDRQGTLAALDLLRQGRPVRGLENRVLARDGSYRWLQWNAQPAGPLIYSIGRDITEQKLAADRLRDAEEQLRQAHKLETVGQLTAGVAHDFNNLLTAILGNLELLESRIADENTARLVRGAMRSAQRGANLNEQLLAFARKQPLLPKVVDLNAVVAGMDPLLRSSIGGAIRIEIVPGHELWPALVDQTQLELVVLNLVINARDAMLVGGSITIETRNVTRGPPARAEEPEAGDYVAISVSDTGCGMTEEVRAKALEPFFTTKGPGKGSGLGLSMVFGVARQSGGGMSLVSAPAIGTTVTVYLPRAAPDARFGQAGSDEALTPLSLVGDEVVLVVDDDSDVREITIALLNSIGYRVLQAGSGAAALDLLATAARVDLMLVDIAMPGMNGIETSRRALALRPGLPFLFATGYADIADLTGRLDARQIIRKPYRRTELAHKLRNLLGRSNTASARGASRSSISRDP